MSFFSTVRKHFVPLVISVLGASIAFLLFADVSSSSSKLSLNERIVPYVLCTEGKTIVKSDSSRTAETTLLAAQERTNVMVGNIIRTQAYSSATVFWPDGSITRLGEASAITIHSLDSNQEGKTNVDFSLEGGKSWTNIARYLDPESNFTQRFDNDTKVAAVRGTVFEINMADDYVRTVDHAIQLKDASTGEEIGHLVSGSIVKATELNQTLPESIVNTTWAAFNQSADEILTKERLEDLKKKVDAYYESIPALQRLQDRLREIFGMTTDTLPLDIKVSSGSVSVNIDNAKLAKLSPAQAKELQNVYEAISGLNNTEATLKSKESLRKALEKALPADKLERLRESFARASLYESWDATRLDLPEQKKALQQDIDSYIKSGVNAGELQKIQNALPKEKIEEMNSKIEEWKKRGFDILSEQEWTKKVLEIDEKGIMDNIKKFNETLDSLTGK